ncbi:MAG: hypothetical protein C4310_03460 [Chloroflexota bacterium]
MASGRPAFIFDMDGTLVDNMAFHVQAWFMFFREQGMDITEDQARAQAFGKTSEEILRAVLGNHLTPAEIAAYAERKEVIYRALYLPQMKPLPGLVDFLREAHRLGIPMAVATSAGMENIRLEGLGIASLFQVVVGAGDVNKGKPDPEIYLTTARRLHIAPERCLVFEDSVLGLEAAYRAGMRAIAVATSHAPHELQALPAVIQVIADYRDVHPASILERLQRGKEAA